MAQENRTIFNNNSAVPFILTQVVFVQNGKNCQIKVLGLSPDGLEEVRLQFPVILGT